MKTILFLFFISIGLLWNSAVMGESLDKQKAIERLNNPENTVGYKLLMISGLSPKAGRDEIRKRMIEDERMLSTIQNRENFFEGIPIERNISEDQLDREIAEETEWCKKLIDFYNNPETCPTYTYEVSNKGPKKASSSIKSYYKKLTQEYYEKGYTWNNCLDYNKIDSTQPIKDKSSIEHNRELVNNLLN